jgi:energy-coupling factor transporter transmembrane protein EcfT
MVGSDWPPIRLSLILAAAFRSLPVLKEFLTLELRACQFRLVVFSNAITMGL